MIEQRFSDALQRLESIEFYRECGTRRQKIYCTAELCSRHATEAVIGFLGRDGNYQKRQPSQLSPAEALNEFKRLWTENAEFQLQSFNRNGIHRFYFTTKTIDDDGRSWDQTITFTVPASNR